MRDKIADNSVAAWTSADAVKMKALYAADPAGFDSVGPSLVTDRATLEKNLDGHAAAKIDHPHIEGAQNQILSRDNFVVSEP